jgi:hypothetical protein
MPLTDEIILKARENENIKAFNDSSCFSVKPRWSVYYDSIHVELIFTGESAFNELMNILNNNDFLRTVTIWVSDGKNIKTTKHKKRLFWYGSERISKLRAKELLEKAAPITNYGNKYE